MIIKGWKVFKAMILGEGFIEILEGSAIYINYLGMLFPLGYRVGL